MIARKLGNQQIGVVTFGSYTKVLYISFSLSFFAFFLVLQWLFAVSSDGEKPPQDLFLVSANLFPLGLLSGVAAWLAQRQGSRAFNKMMIVLTALFSTGLSLLFLIEGAPFTSAEDRAAYLAMMVPGIVLLVSQWVVVRIGFSGRKVQ